MRQFVLLFLVGTLLSTSARGAQDAAAGSTPAVDAEDWLAHRIELLDEVGGTLGRDSLFNSHQRLSSYVFDPVVNTLRLNGEFSAHFPLGILLKSQLASGLVTGRESTPTFAIRELYANLPLGSFDFAVGRKILKWSNGYAFTPAGLLDPKRNPSDPSDRLHLTEGRNLAQLDYYFGPHLLTGAFSSNWPAQVSGEPHSYQALLRADFVISALSLDVAATAMKSSAHDAATLTASYVLGDALSFHTEIVGTRGTDALYPQSILPGMQQTLFGPPGGSPPAFLVALNQDSSRLFLRYLVGVNYTLVEKLNLIAEFYHSDTGLSQAEWNRFLDQIRFSQQQLDTTTYPAGPGGLSLPEGNLLQGLSYLSGGSIRRNYLFVRASDSWLGEQLGVSALVLVNLHDGGVLPVAELTLLLHRATFYLRAIGFAGSRRSEFANLGMIGELSGGIRIGF